MAMTNNEVTYEQATAVVDRVSAELGLLVEPKSGFLCVKGPTNEHRIYIQRSKRLKRIDCTIDLDPSDPAWRQLSNPNGSVRCHVAPDLEQLERVLRMLGDGTLPKQVPNKPRPFGASKQPAPRRPQAVVPPVPEAALQPLPGVAELEERLAHIHRRAREARINMFMDNPQKYGSITRQEAEDIADGKVDRYAFKQLEQAEIAVDLSETLEQSGIEVS